MLPARLTHLTLKWGLGLLCVCAALLILLTTSAYEDADSRFSLLSSQALLENGTLELTPYQADVEGELFPNYRIFEIEGRLYYGYPPGASLFSLPVVWLANRLGYDMRDRAAEAGLQKVLEILTSQLVLLALYATARTRLSPTASLTFSGSIFFGTILISTLGTALWSLNFSALFMLLGVWRLLRFEDGARHPLDAFWFALLCVAAFLSRPTAAIFIALLLLYLFWRDRWFGTATAILAFLGLIPFILYALQLYGDILPPYYLPSRFGGGEAFTNQVGDGRTPRLWIFYGLLFSPSRGFFVYSPPALLLIALLGGWLRRLWQTRAQRPLLTPTSRLTLFGLLWFTGNLLLISTFREWWGGFGFGPRLLVDSIPAAGLLGIVLWPTLSGSLTQRSRRFAILAFGLLTALGVILNSGIGLFSEPARFWNGGGPTPSTQPGVMFDWRYPQFAATYAGLCARSHTYTTELLDNQYLSLRPLPFNQTLPVGEGHVDQYLDLRYWFLPYRPAPRVAVIRSSAADLEWRYFLPQVAEGSPRPAAIYAGLVASPVAPSAFCDQVVGHFGPAVTQPPANAQLQLALHAQGINAPQRVRVVLNGRQIGELTAGTDDAVYTLEIDPSLLQAQARNVLQFDLPDVVNPFADSRLPAPQSVILYSVTWQLRQP